MLGQHSYRGFHTMRIRSVLLSATVLMTGFLVTPAYAAGAVSPLGNWSVSKVDMKQVGSAPYCALNRRFSNGSLVTFARNTNNEISLAMDFPKSTLKTGKTAQVTFDAGAGQRRDFETKPVSERGIVVRMGQDDAFFDAIGQSGQLTIKVDGNELTFAMPDIDTGAQDLSACLGPMTEPAAGELKSSLAPITEIREVAPARAEPIRIAQMEELSKQPVKPIDLTKASTVVSKQKDKDKEKQGEAAPLVASASDSDMGLQSLKEENIRLKNALERERRAYEDKFAELGADTSSAAELQEKLRLLEVENKQLRTGGQSGSVSAAVDAKAAAPVCPAVKPNTDQTAAMTALKNENDRLKVEIATLESAPKASHKADPAVPGLKDRIASLESENRALRSAAGPLQAGDTEGLKQNVATIARLKAVEAQFDGLRAERDRLAAEINSIRNAEGTTRVQIASDNWDLETATKRFNEAEREIRRLGSALEAERAKCTVEKKDLEFMLFDPKVAEKEQITRLIKLEEALNVAQNALNTRNNADQSKVSTLESRIRDLEGQIGSEGGKLSAAESRARDLEQQLAQTKLTTGQQGKDLESRIALETQKATAAEARIRDLEQQLAQTKLTADQQAQAQIGASSEKLALAEKQLKDLESRTTLEAQKASASETRVRDLEQQLAAAQGAADSRIRETQQQLTTAHAATEIRMRDLEQQLVEAKAAANSNATLAQANTDKAVAYQTQINTLTQQLAGATADSARLQAALSEVQAQNAAGANDKVLIDTLKKEIASLNTQLDNLQNEKSAMATQLSQITPAAGDATSPSRLSAAPQTVVSNANPVEVDRVSGIPAARASVPVTRAVVAAPAVMPVASSATQSIRLMGKSEIEGLLKRAGVETSGGVQSIGGAATSRVAYRWQTSGLFGTAEQKAMESPQQFDRFVQDYLDKTRSRCPGQFAAVPALLESTSAGQIASYEIACVDNAGSGASAALIFTGRDQVFTTIAHEAAPESMDFAMDARDRLLSVMHTGKVAGR